MIIIISAASFIIIIALFLGKKLFIKKLQYQYEKCLLKGDREKAAQIGKTYYLYLDERDRKMKGVVDIDAKISDDFRAFNNHNIPFS